MIGKLTGRLDSVNGQHMVIDVGGVGYVVAASARTLRHIEGSGAVVALLIETQVREDAINLYGFADALERDWFRLLTTVQGVGARVALAILSALAPERLAQAVVAQDKVLLTQADGVGPKLALRLVTELKDKVASFGTPPNSLSTPPPSGGPSNDALSALINLGYGRADAFMAVTAAAQQLGPDATLPTLIRASLGQLGLKDHAA